MLIRDYEFVLSCFFFFKLPDVKTSLTGGCDGISSKYLHWEEDLIVGGTYHGKSGQLIRYTTRGSQAFFSFPIIRCVACVLGDEASVEASTYFRPVPRIDSSGNVLETISIESFAGIVPTRIVIEYIRSSFLSQARARESGR